MNQHVELFLPHPGALQSLFSKLQFVLKLANGHLLLNIVFKSVQFGSCFLVHGHELDLGLHHSHYFIDLVDLVLCKTAISVVEVGAPDVPEEIIAAVLALEGSR